VAQDQQAQLWSRLRSIEKKLDSAVDTALMRTGADYSPAVLAQDLGLVYIILREMIEFLRYAHEVPE
jgi:hypothetical protein